VEVPRAAECCGAAGTYSILRPRDSRRILDDKLDELEAAGVDLDACADLVLLERPLWDAEVAWLADRCPSPSSPDAVEPTTLV
jgi:Fe-S oxidoreductase